MSLKPTSYPGWIPNNTSNIVVPPGGKLTSGWLPLEKPPSQYFNWFFNLVSQWINFAGPGTPSAIIGAEAYCTHATLAAAVADSGLGTNIRVLLVDSQNISATVHLTKAGWQIDALPGVTYTKSGVVSGISCEAAGVQITNLRFAAWSTSGDKAVTGTSAWTYGRVMFCNFNNCDTEVDTSNCTAGKIAVTLGNITE